MNYRFIIFFLVLFFPLNAHAYLDPGSGSALIQIILAFLAGLGAFISVYWERLKVFFSSFFKKKEEDKDN
tara:strand:+ start:29 stop:238 length:210 start_codon:yes stop_codon:yes gene_type:complete